MGNNIPSFQIEWLGPNGEMLLLFVIQLLWDIVSVVIRQ